MHRPLFLLAIFLLAIGAVFAFSKQFTSTPPQKEEKKLEKIKIAYRNPEALAAILGAKQAGILDKYGLDVELTSVEKSIDALSIGDFDAVIANGFVAALAGAVKGAGFIWIAAITNNDEHFIISRVPKEKIKTMAAGVKGSEDYTRTIIGLQLIGVDTSTINFISLRSGRKAAFSKGEIDAAPIDKSDWDKFQKEAPEGTEVIFSFADAPNLLFPISVLTRKEVVEQRSEALIKLLAAMLEGSVYVKNNRGAIEAILIHEYGFDEATAKSELDSYIRIVKNLQFLPNTTPVKEILPILARDVKEAESFDADKFVDDSLAREAIKRVDFAKIVADLNN